MSSIYKFIFFFILFALLALGGFKLFPWLNARIRNSNTGWEMLGNLVFMIVVYGVLFSGGLLLLIYSYQYLSENAPEK